jgi:hypothetical protein
LPARMRENERSVARAAGQLSSRPFGGTVLLLDSRREARVEDRRSVRLAFWVRRPNQESIPTHPDRVLEAERLLRWFASTARAEASSPEEGTVRVEVMDEFTSQGWKRAASVAQLDLRQTPRAILGIVLENANEYSAWIMLERTIAAGGETVVAWQPEFGLILDSTTDQLRGLLSSFLEEGVLSRAAEGFRYTGKRPSVLSPDSQAHRP